VNAVRPDRLSELFDKSSLKEIIECVGPNESLSIKIAREKGVEITVERQSKASTSTGFSAPDPYEVLKAAIKTVPAVKYALAVGGIVAVIAIVAGWKVDFRIAVFGVVIMLVLMTSMVVFARLAKESASVFRAPAVVFMWFSVILTMACAIAVFLSVFVGWPADWRGVISAHKLPPIPPLVTGGAPVGSRFQYSYKDGLSECLSEYVKVSGTEWYEQASPEASANCKAGAILVMYTERKSNETRYILLYDESRKLFARLNNTPKGHFSPTEWRLVSDETWNAGHSVTRIN
jgi:hypothetical protein